MPDERPIVLYVDDDPNNRIVFEQSFRKSFALRTVASGDEALQVLDSAPVAVLVSDQRMPGMTGNELLEKVRKLHPRVVRIVLTAYEDLDPILRAVNEGLVARYIIKPFDQKELAEILEWSLEAFERASEGNAVQLRLLQTERLATIGSLTLGLIHDLANVLQQMHTDVQRLEDLSAASAALHAWLGEGRTPSPSQRKLLGDLAGELPEIAEALRESVALMSQISAGAQRPLKTRSSEAQVCDAVRAIEDSLALFRGSARRITLAYRGPRDLPYARMRGSELAQVLINLVSNACHALCERDGHVTVSARTKGSEIEITVADDGPGMAPEVLANAGKLFFSTREGGTGIGLAQCRRLVASAQGTFDIRSTPGTGTTVTVTLPAALTTP